MHTHILILLIFALLVCGHASLLSGAPGKSPNIVLIVSDDQGYGDFSYYGNPYLNTQNLDRLAEESTRLRNFYVSPKCSPTRASLLTGRYNQRTGVWDTWKGRDMMHPDEITIAEVLSNHGYKTAHFGKWHLGTNYPFRAQDQGFEYSFTWDGLERMNPSMLENGETSKYEGFLPHIIADKAVEFINKNSNHSFFAYIPFYQPHTHFRKQVPDSSVEPFHRFQELSQEVKEIYAMVQELDIAVGAVLAAIDDAGIRENTVVIYISDNGAHLPGDNMRYNYGYRGRKGTTLQGGIKSPCFIRYGNFPVGSIAENAAHIDIFPTILEICGITKPQYQKVDGVSLYNLLKARTALEPRNLYIQLSGRAKPEVFVNSTVISGSHKLHQSGTLYDLKDDPGELRNIYGQSLVIAEKLKRDYLEWFADVTSERPFEPAYTIVGSEKQEVITLYHTKLHETRGYPIQVESTGYYRFSFLEFQPYLYPENGKLGISYKGREALAAIEDTEATAIVIDRVFMEKGQYDLHIVMKNKVPELFKYGNEDMGFRKLTIERIDN